MITDEQLNRLQASWDEVKKNLNGDYNEFIMAVENGEYDRDISQGSYIPANGSIRSLSLTIKLWCGLNPFYIMPDSSPGIVEILAHRKVLHHIKKREKYWKDCLPVEVQAKLIPTSHHKLRILIDNGLGHGDLKGE